MICVIGLQLRAKHPIPESAGDTKSLFVVLIMVFEMVFLHLLNVIGQLGMVERIMHGVISDV